MKVVIARGGDRQTLDLPAVPRLGDRVVMPAEDGVWEYLLVVRVSWELRFPDTRKGIHGEWIAVVDLGT